MTILTSFKSRKCFCLSVALRSIVLRQFLRHEEKKVVECRRSSFVLGRSGTGFVTVHYRTRYIYIFCHGRKTTVIVFKIFGIERAWQNQGCVGPRPRQLFITKSRLLAEKVERDHVSLLYSLSTGPDTPLYVRERIQRWNFRRKKMIFNPDDTEEKRDDLPEKFSELRDSDFPLFLTMDTVSTAYPMDASCINGFCTCIFSSLAFWRLTCNLTQGHLKAESYDRKERKMNGTVAQSW